MVGVNRRGPLCAAARTPHNSGFSFMRRFRAQKQASCFALRFSDCGGGGGGSGVSGANLSHINQDRRWRVHIHCTIGLFNNAINGGWRNGTGEREHHHQQCRGNTRDVRGGKRELCLPNGMKTLDIKAMFFVCMQYAISHYGSFAADDVSMRPIKLSACVCTPPNGLALSKNLRIRRFFVVVVVGLRRMYAAAY